MATEIEVRYIDGDYEEYTAEENILGDYDTRSDIMVFDSKGSTMLIPYTNVKSIIIKKEEEIHGKEKERAGRLSAETSRT